ncbi:hypothetical protein [Gilvibacter sp.]|uniref:hypothetical protein n=1 Tax=Gilvibacter sp. TaxID=2729997 RepID=UPI0025C0DC92|nr:hypothetical protein [Gilvibacter sp.]NQX76810.1 hypothetical protein [Gilvibacter sp.]
MRKTLLILLGFFALLILLGYLALKLFVIEDTQPEDCVVKEIKITAIDEGSSYDIFFTADNGERYYINRGLEQGLTLNSLKKMALNRTASVHLAKFAVGVSNHIAQLQVGDSIIFTEFD